MTELNLVVVLCCAFFIGVAIAGILVTKVLLCAAWEYYVENSGDVRAALRGALIVAIVTLVAYVIAQSIWGYSFALTLLGTIAFWKFTTR